MRTPAQAVAWANKVTSGYSNYCLMFVRLAYGIAAKYGSAIAAWNGAKYRHRSLANAPVGAFVFLSHPKSRYGHVALLSKRMADGDHLIRTTNSAVGRPVTQRISLWTKGYGYTLLGWTEDINGVRVEALAPKKKKAPARKDNVGFYGRGDSGAGVAELQRVLNRWYPRLQPLKVDGSYGPKTEARVKYFQQRARLTVDGLAGPKTLRRLGLEWRQ